MIILEGSSIADRSFLHISINSSLIAEKFPVLSSLTTAMISSPWILCGIPTTAHSNTFSCVWIAFSIDAGLILIPPRMIRSFFLPVM